MKLIAIKKIVDMIALHQSDLLNFMIIHGMTKNPTWGLTNARAIVQGDPNRIRAARRKSIWPTKSANKNGKNKSAQMIRVLRNFHAKRRLAVRKRAYDIFTGRREKGTKKIATNIGPTKS
jgi:hypothetical protein